MSRQWMSSLKGMGARSRSTEARFGGGVIFIFTMLVAWVLAGAAGLANKAEAKVTLKAEPVSEILLAGEKQTTYLRIGLEGFRAEPEKDRPGLNLAIVLDKSGSMQGEKIEEARNAAIMAIGRLRENDIISVVVYDTTVDVVVPATKVSDREAIYDKIRAIEAGGSTALFAGVSKGAEEVRKFFSRNRVNRIILLSDGLANVGPQSPAELGDLGASLGKDGITVFTIGLGLQYNEDLMTRLAASSDGGHIFAENANDLRRVFDQEFGKAMAVVAQKIRIEIECEPGIRPVRVLGRDADISSNKVFLPMNHLYSDDEKFIILEVEVLPQEEGKARNLARVKVRYENMADDSTDELTGNVRARFSRSQAEVERGTNRPAMADAVHLIAVVNNQRAMDLRDKGQVQQAQQALISNSAFLKDKAASLGSKKLDTYAVQNEQDASNLTGESWNRQRKVMQETQGDAFSIR